VPQLNNNLLVGVTACWTRCLVLSYKDVCSVCALSTMVIMIIMMMVMMMILIIIRIIIIIRIAFLTSAASTPLQNRILVDCLVSDDTILPTFLERLGPRGSVVRLQFHSSSLCGTDRVCYWIRRWLNIISGQIYTLHWLLI